jgi:hypothetical protein
MDEQSLAGNGNGKPRELPVLSKERREFPDREKLDRLRETDESGDVIFRFKLNRSDSAGVGDLEDFYRSTIRDLLKIVRFSYRGQPVIVDEFAFLNNPHERLRILDETNPQAAGKELELTS